MRLASTFVIIFVFIDDLIKQQRQQPQHKTHTGCRFANQTLYQSLSTLGDATRGDLNGDLNGDLGDVDSDLGRT